MARASLGGLELEYDVRGTGEPVVLIHHGAGLDWFSLLLEQPAFVDRYRVIRYHRAGYGLSDPLPGPLSFADEAAHCRSLLQHLGIERAHIVGHSSSAMITLQLALDAPDAVGTLALLESARPAPETPTQAEFVRTVAMPTLQLYRSGDAAAASDIWLRGVCGPDYRPVLERALPGAIEQALQGVDMYFGQEVPAVQQWTFTADDAHRVTQPALAVLGERSVPTFPERHQLLLDWLPDVEAFVLPEAGHLLVVENPGDLAQRLVDFLGRHPLGR